MAEDRVPCFGGTLPANVSSVSVTRDDLLERLLPLLEDRTVLKRHGASSALVLVDAKIANILFLLGG